MRKVNDKNLLRLIDANFNRAKEGLRVCEDVCRFLLNKKLLTKNYKDLRHRLTDAIEKCGLKSIVCARDIEGDCGRETSMRELKREQTDDVFYANSQRVKESLRVLEEFTKLLNKSVSQDLKDLRYDVYALEKKVVKAR